MRMAGIILVSLWAGVYTGALALALWRRKQYRGAVGTALIATLVLILPGLVEFYKKQM